MEIGFRPFDEQGNMIRSGRACTAKKGVVSAGRAEAAQIGKEILEKGGNAVDAAVAVAFALGVCEPNASGIGGGGFMLLRSARTGESVFLNFREKAPKAAEPSMYEPGSPGSNYDKHLRNVYSGTAAATPGDVAGLLYALEHYGTLDRKTVMAPAIRLAKEGYIVTPLLAADIAEHAEQLRKYGDGWKIYLKDGKATAAGEILKNPDLAQTLEKIAESGRDVFYKGEIAKAITAAPMTTKGLRRKRRRKRLTPFCTWLMSLVMRVTSVDVPTLSISAKPRLWMWSKSCRRSLVETPVAAREATN